MKHASNVFIILLILGLVTMCCAGCISIGKTTSEINVGNHTLGTVTLSPDTSAEHFNIDLDILDIIENKSFINSLPDDDKTKLLKLLTEDNASDISTFQNNTKKNGTQDDETDFWVQIMNIKLTKDSNKTLSDSLTAPQLDNSLEEAINDLNKFLDDFKI